MGNDWEEVSLGNNVDHQKGFIFKSKDYQDEGEIIVRVSDFTDRSIDINSCNKIDESRADEFESVKLKAFDVVIATVGSWPKNPASIVGKTISVPKEAAGGLLNQNAVRLRAINGLNQRYLFCLLKTRDFQNYIVSTAQGSANQASITLKDIFRFTFYLPKPKEQKAIAHILGSLDDKIELNRQMNETLESMAQALFKSWFVDFDPVIDNALAAGNPIPDVFGKRAEQRKLQAGTRRAVKESENSHQSLFPSEFEFTEEMGWIPKGWGVNTIKDEAVKISKGTTPNKKIIESSPDEGIIPFLKVRDLDDEGKINMVGLALIPASIHESALKRSILKTGDLLFSIAGTIGRVAVVPQELDNSNSNQALAFIRLKEKNKINYFLQLLKSHEVQSEVKSKIVQAVQANVSLTELGNLQFAKASEDIFNLWFSNTNDIYVRIDGLQKESSTLSKLRDTLLPKLLSGELRIPDAETLIKEAGV